jgi:hypothetical protein
VDEKDEFTLHGDTVRNLEVLAQAPGEVRFRLGLARAMDNIRTDIKLMQADMNAKFKALEKEQRKSVTLGQVAAAAAKEFEPTKKDVERLWGAGKWFLVAMGTIAVGSVGTLITLILTRAFSK